MPDFQGFPSKTRFTRIPEEFFTRFLPEISCPYTLKTVLYAFWRLEKTEASVFFLLQQDYEDDPVFMEGMGSTQEEQKRSLKKSLDNAVQYGIFLQETTKISKRQQNVYLINSPKGRLAAEGLQKGQWKPENRGKEHIELMQQATNAFKLYEENIGPLTPMIADMIREDERVYPAVWIEDAVRLAVKNNKRSWSYIQAILKRWQVEGR